MYDMECEHCRTLFPVQADFQNRFSSTHTSGTTVAACETQTLNTKPDLFRFNTLLHLTRGKEECGKNVSTLPGFAHMSLLNQRPASLCR